MKYKTTKYLQALKTLEVEDGDYEELYENLKILGYKWNCVHKIWEYKPSKPYPYKVKKPKPYQIWTRIDADLKERLEAAVIKLDVSVSKFVYDAIAEKMQKHLRNNQ